MIFFFEERPSYPSISIFLFMGRSLFVHRPWKKTALTRWGKLFNSLKFLGNLSLSLELAGTF